MFAYCIINQLQDSVIVEMIEENAKHNRLDQKYDVLCLYLAVFSY